MKLTFTRILVPTDFSPASAAALQYAKALAERLGASMHVLHVVEDPYTVGAWSEVYVPDCSALRQKMVEESERRLTNIRSSLEPVSATTEVLLGSPRETIVGTAKERGIDLIVMGTHGRRGVSHVLLGSVAERVIRTAPCPVLAVREGAAGAAASTSSEAGPKTSAA